MATSLRLRVLGPVELPGFDPKAFCRTGSETWALVDGIVSLLDQDLRVANTLELPRLPSGSRLHDVKDGAALASSDGQLRLLERDGMKTLPVTDADRAKFVGGAILATAPEGDGHKIVLLSRDGTMQAEYVEEEAPDAVGWIHPHPSGRPEAVVEFGVGQDGCIMVTATIDVAAGTLTVTPLDIPEEYVVSGFNPAGSTLLLGAHPNDAHIIALMDWASKDITHTLRSDGILSQQNGAGGADDDEDEMDPGFDIYAGWLTPDLVVSSTTQYGLRVVITDGSLQCPRLAHLPDYDPPPPAEDAEILWLYPVSDRRFVARVWTDSGTSTRLYEVEQ